MPVRLGVDLPPEHPIILPARGPADTRAENNRMRLTQDDVQSRMSENMNILPCMRLLF